MASAEEDEVMAEVEAVQAVYGDDCVILQSYPPHLHLHIKPRTADVTSQQFVEAVIEIRAGSKYPEEVPHIDLIDSKGFDEQRQQELITCIRDKACELSCYLMLVSLCEEAVEKLSIMNHPDGDCPLCLYPLVPEDEKIKILPFMKLMSCFHCFHSECIIRWWNWLQTEKEAHAVDSSSVTIRPSSFMGNEKDIHKAMEEREGTCPVCRKVFLAKDFEHVLDLVGSHSSQLNFDEDKVDDNETLLQSDSEIVRRQKFEAALSLQQENSGLIEPKKNIAVLPGMYLQQSVASSAATSTNKSAEQERRDPPAPSETRASGSSNTPSTGLHKHTGMRKHRAWNPRKPVRQPVASPITMSTKEAEQQRRVPAATLETRSVGSSNGPSTSEHRTSGMRKHRGWNSRKPVEQWIKKENATAE
ncbi:e3 ubiquitin-protein ligase rnf25 [Fagus crenata]